MKGPTVSFDSDWRVAVPKVEVCPKCGGKWAGGDGPHGHRVLEDGTRVDCRGGVVDIEPHVAGETGRSTSEGSHG